MSRVVHFLAMRKKLILGLILSGVSILAIAAYVYGWRAGAPRSTNQVPSSTAVAKVTGVDMRMLVMGDVYWGRFVNDWSMASPLKYAYPFQQLGQFDRGNYDAWIANLECPVTNNQKASSLQEDKTLTFDCSPNYLPEASKWFSAVSLGNNHTGNQGGRIGLDETRQHLMENTMQFFGTYDAEDTNDVCEIISLPVHIAMSDKTAKAGVLPMAWCGYDGVFATPSSSSISVVGRYAQLFTTIVMPHSGLEYQPAPDQIKISLYRGFIDNGADVVIGNHPHWVQTSEAYNGHLIIYSLGNFIFDQQFSPEVTRAAVLSISASVTALDAPDLDKWLAFGEQCTTYHDSCLDKARDQHLEKLPLNLHFSVLGSVDDSKVTRRANDEQLAAIKQRLRWSETISGLKGLSSAE